MVAGQAGRQEVARSDFGNVRNGLKPEKLRLSTTLPLSPNSDRKADMPGRPFSARKRHRVLLEMKEAAN